MKKLREEIKKEEIKPTVTRDPLIEAILLAGILARNNWEPTEDGVRHLLKTKIRPLLGVLHGD